MDTYKIAAIILIVIGVVALAYGGFSYTTETHEASIGSLSLSIDEQRNVNIPVWVGVGSLVVGGLLFFLGGSRRQ